MAARKKEKNEKIKKIAKIFLASSLFLGSVFAYQGIPGPKGGNSNELGNQYQYKYQYKGSNLNHNTSNFNIEEYLLSLPLEELSDVEEKDLVYMREEEKLARDVYLFFYRKYNLSIFKNIAESEQKHMDLVKLLIDKYSLEDPVEITEDVEGEFVNTALKELYNDLIEKGSESVVEALKVGALIEDLDIKDLKESIENADNRDIKVVYYNLMKGSRNHLRAFVSNLEKYNQSYSCQYISEEECLDIISSDWERELVYDQDNKILFKGNNKGKREMLNRIKSNKNKFMEQIRNRKSFMKQKATAIMEKVKAQIKTQGKLDENTRNEMIKLIKEMLQLKLEEILVKVVDTPNEEIYSEKIMSLIEELNNNSDLLTIKYIFEEYLKIKRELGN